MWNAYGRCTAAGDSITYLATGLDLALVYPLVRAGTNALRATATLVLVCLWSGTTRKHPGLLPQRQQHTCLPACGLNTFTLTLLWLQPLDLPGRVDGAALVAAVKGAFGATPQLTCQGCAPGALHASVAC